jgi:hypothetical protein
MEVTISPNDRAEFSYGHEDGEGVDIELGTFQFASDGPDSVLDISHGVDTTHFRNPHLTTCMDEKRDGNWNAKRLEGGVYEVTEEAGVGKEGLCSTRGQFNFRVVK